MTPWIVKDFGEEPEGRPGGPGMDTSQAQCFYKDLGQRKFGGPLDIWYHICRHEEISCREIWIDHIIRSMGSSELNKSGSCRRRRRQLSQKAFVVRLASESLCSVFLKM